MLAGWFISYNLLVRNLLNLCHMLGIKSLLVTTMRRIMLIQVSNCVKSCVMCVVCVGVGVGVFMC